MKKPLLLFVFLCVLCGKGFSQNLTTVSASNITDINGFKLAAGQLCFLITDQSDNPISVSIGGGGQALKRGYCSPVAAGVVTTFTVPNPSATSPSGIYYRVTVSRRASPFERHSEPVTRQRQADLLAGDEARKALLIWMSSENRTPPAFIFWHAASNSKVMFLVVCRLSCRNTSGAGRSFGSGGSIAGAPAKQSPAVL